MFPLNVPLYTIPNDPSPNFFSSINSSGSNIVVTSVVAFIPIWYWLSFPFFGFNVVNTILSSILHVHNGLINISNSHASPFPIVITFGSILISYL